MHDESKGDFLDPSLNQEILIKPFNRIRTNEIPRRKNKEKFNFSEGEFTEKICVESKPHQSLVYLKRKNPESTLYSHKINGKLIKSNSSDSRSSYQNKSEKIMIKSTGHKNSSVLRKKSTLTKLFNNGNYY
jgi:hypothetical protein